MRRHPDWLKVDIPGGESYVRVKSMLRNAKLHTICEEAKCPNIAECFGSGTAVFLILGDTCTRNCKYCNVKHGEPLVLDPDEPRNVAESVKQLDLKYAVITSVTRDDLVDGGASVFAQTVKEIKNLDNNIRVEVLIPDFKGSRETLKTVVDAGPDVVNHNIEVVEMLFPMIRPEGDYKTSLSVLENVKEIKKDMLTKSGFMVGLGENKDQIVKTMRDLRGVDVDFLTIGQYLQPTKEHAEIKKYYTPYEFNDLKRLATWLGFRHVESGPLVRSSYHAEKTLIGN